MTFVRNNIIPRMLPLAGSLLLVLMSLLSGCSTTTKQSTLDPKGPVAQIQFDLFMITVWVSLGIFIVVGGALAWAVWRYRERPGDENRPLPVQGHGNPLIEIGLIVVSIGLLVIIAVPTLRAIWFTHELPEDTEFFQDSKLGVWYPGEIPEGEADNILDIYVYGWQWWWSFEYPQFGITTANEMAFPVNRVVRLHLRSVDVIHSFWLPKIAGKVDLIPGRRNWMWIMADEPGHYYGQCAEFCGEAHAYMLFRADALEPDEFQAWVEAYQRGADAPAGFRAEPTDNTPEPSARDDWAAWSQAMREHPERFADDPVHLGAQLFMGKGRCIVCHAVDNSPAMGALGPNLTRLASRASLGAGILDNRGPDGEIDPEIQFENFYNWISNSQHYKPGNLMYYTDAGLVNLKMNGLTYADVQRAGVSDRLLRRAGVRGNTLREIRENPDVDLNRFLSRYQLERIVAHIPDENLVEDTQWLSAEEFRQISAFLQTLK